MSEPQYTDGGLLLPEHKSEDLLARRLYLVVCYRENETLPFSHMLLRGADVVHNDLPAYYRYFLLEATTK
jgi:hypothetical protein